MIIPLRDNIRAYITANGPSTAADITADSISKGSPLIRIERTIGYMTTNGRLIKTGEDYSLPV